MDISQETRLKKAHVALMKHQETSLYSSIFLMGKNVVEDGIPTAYTDGHNKKYGREFMAKIKEDSKIRGLVLHENLHVALKHLIRFKKEFKANPQLINMAADFVVNDIIMSLNDKGFCELPDGGLHEPFFHDWSVREVYNYLLKNAKSTKPPPNANTPCDKDNTGQSGDGSETGKAESLGNDFEVDVNGKKYESHGFDEHDFEKAINDMTPEQAQELSDKIDKAMREGGILAGRMGAKVPRAIGEMLEPQVDWKEVLRDFVTSSSRGTDEFTWRKFNKRMMANELYMPSVENETVGELVVAIDTSGSIGSKELTEFATELASICDAVSPSKVRVLWWDTQVHGEQEFEDNYQNIGGLLKPLGGGGTHVSCVSEYISANKISAEGVIIFTDGYVESDIKWDISTPTLWLVTERKNFIPPASGKVVNKLN
jgi:predicted metal-dependent peptidase